MTSFDSYEAEKERVRKAGFVGNRHFTSYVGRVKKLKKEGQHEKAIALLLKLVNATEAEAKAEGSDWNVAPWYYEQLAIIYRKEKQYWDEISVLERYEALRLKCFKALELEPYDSQQSGDYYEPLLDRLEKAKKRFVSKKSLPSF